MYHRKQTKTNNLSSVFMNITSELFKSEINLSKILPILIEILAYKCGKQYRKSYVERLAYQILRTNLEFKPQ